MLRIRIALPPTHFQYYRHRDLIHDALVNAWLASGAAPEQIIGHTAQAWTFAALGQHRQQQGQVHSLIVSTSDAQLALYLSQWQAHYLRYARAATAELLNFSAASITIEPDPIAPQQGFISALLLSPLAIRVPNSRRWANNFQQLDLAAAINQRLSVIAGRTINLQIQADSLYLRANPQHSVLISLKHTAKGHSFVIGLQAPLVLAGSEDDLRLAWYAGVGEKTRNGFGCLGLLEQGVGR